MRKLTKIIKKRRKNYKPTIGVEFKNGKRFSVNLYEWHKYLKAKQAKEEAQAEAEARRLLWGFMKENCPKLVEALGMFSHLGNYMY